MTTGKKGKEAGYERHFPLITKFNPKTAVHEDGVYNVDD